ncbi:MAG TPA: amidohydrolase, partial [Acidimicrobiia bacterium]|nr:amidohydrolase [Acidimicrobiia bacterium]
MTERRATIDIHCHRECAPAAALVKPEADRLGRAPLQVGNELTKAVNRQQLETIRPKMESVEVRLADMDALGIDIQVISLS